MTPEKFLETTETVECRRLIARIKKEICIRRQGYLVHKKNGKIDSVERDTLPPEWIEVACRNCSQGMKVIEAAGKKYKRPRKRSRYSGYRSSEKRK